MVTTPHSSARGNNNNGLCVAVRIRPVVGEEHLWKGNGPIDRSRLLSNASKWTWGANTITAIQQQQQDLVGGSSRSTSAVPIPSRSASTMPSTPGVDDHHHKGSRFNFNHVFAPGTTTNSVFETLAVPIVDEFCHGFNGCIFAFGQTNSGKTYTISGDDDGKAPGILPLAVNRVFDFLSAVDDGVDGNNAAAVGGLQAMVKISFMEVYNEVVRDLLSNVPEDRHADWSTAPSVEEEPASLHVMESGEGNVVVNGLSEHIVGSLGDVQDLIAFGEARRSIGANSAHVHASRSHTIFQLTLETRQAGQHAVKQSVLNIIDLAGSESTYAPTTEDLRQAADARAALGTIANITKLHQQQQKTKLKNMEGSNIRKSLHALIRCVDVLASGKSKNFVPFRDSKLTRLLRNSLGGNSNTAIICNVNPEEDKETMATLRFAANATKIQGGAKTVTVIDDQHAMLGRYEQQLRQLQIEMDLRNNASSSQLRCMQHRHQEAQDELEAQAKEREKLEIQCRNLNRLLMTSEKIRAEQLEAEEALKMVRTKKEEEAGCNNDSGSANAIALPRRRSNSLPKHANRCVESKSFFHHPDDDAKKIQGERKKKPVTNFAMNLIADDITALKQLTATRHGDNTKVAASPDSELAEQVQKDILHGQQRKISEQQVFIAVQQRQIEDLQMALQKAQNSTVAEVNRLNGVVEGLEADKKQLHNEILKQKGEIAAAQDAAILNGRMYLAEQELVLTMPRPMCSGGKKLRRPQMLSAEEFKKKFGPSLSCNTAPIQ